MSKLKSTQSTTNRIITMVESGDYDRDIIEHMIASIVANRDRRIKQLEKKVRDKDFNITPKIISGALRNTIRQHGDITSEWIGSAAKRIYGNCQQLTTKPEPIVRDPAIEDVVTVTREKNSTHKLTVAHDGKIRIKIARETPDDEGDYIIKSFTDIGQKALLLGMTTLRGKTKRGDKQTRVNNLTLYTDSKKEYVTFNY